MSFVETNSTQGLQPIKARFFIITKKTIKHFERIKVVILYHNVIDYIFFFKINFLISFTKEIFFSYQHSINRQNQ